MLVFAKPAKQRKPVGWFGPVSTEVVKWSVSESRIICLVQRVVHSASAIFVLSAVTRAFAVIPRKSKQPVSRSADN